MVLRGTMAWRKADPAHSVTVAVVMALPGLFGEAVRQLVFPWATGLQPMTQPKRLIQRHPGKNVALSPIIFNYRASQLKWAVHYFGSIFGAPAAALLEHPWTLGRRPQLPPRSP